MRQRELRSRDTCEADQQHRAPADKAKKNDADNCGHDRRDTDGDGGDQRCADAKAALLQNRWRVIVHRVDAGGLLHDRQAAADQHHPPDPRDVADHREGGALGGQGALGVFDDRVELHLGLTRVQAQSKDAACLGQSAFEAVPARRIRQHHHAEQQCDGRDSGDRQHDAPHVRIVNQVIQQGVHREGQHLTGDDHQLVDRHHSSATLRRCHLREIQRARHRGRANTEAKNDAGGHHDLDSGCECASQRADQKHARTQQQGALAPDPVRDATTEQRAEGSAGEQQRAHDRRFGK